MPLSEDQALTILQEELASSEARRAGRLRLGIGDDTAVLKKRSSDQLWTIDSCEEGIHFRFDWMKPEDVAHKSLHSAMSDIGAMGGIVRAVLCHLTLTRRTTARWLRRFARAQAEISDDVGMAIAGGNISFGERLCVATTVIGDAPPGGALTRTGAQAGEQLWLVGNVGLARAGLMLLDGDKRPRASGAGASLQAFRRPRALLSDGRRLVGRASSCLDVSDGLAKDANELARSSGVQVIVELDKFESALSPELRRAASLIEKDVVQLALQGGEDYALLASGPASRRPRFAVVIGRIERGRGVFIESSGSKRPLKGGFVHGRS